MDYKKITWPDSFRDHIINELQIKNVIYTDDPDGLTKEGKYQLYIERYIDIEILNDEAIIYYPPNIERSYAKEVLDRVIISDYLTNEIKDRISYTTEFRDLESHIINKAENTFNTLLHESIQLNVDKISQVFSDKDPLEANIDFKLNNFLFSGVNIFDVLTAVHEGIANGYKDQFKKAFINKVINDMLGDQSIVKLNPEFDLRQWAIITKQDLVDHLGYSQLKAYKFLVDIMTKLPRSEWVECIEAHIASHIKQTN